MSKMFAKIRQWYAVGIWTRSMVLDAVRKGKITEEEHREITGEEYA